MHVINGSPATFDGRQISAISENQPIVLRSTFIEVKTDQQTSREWRRQQGLEILYSYGYRRVILP